MTLRQSLRTADVDLSTCDREPIHLPGSIQPHGALLVLDERAQAVLQASDNVNAYLGQHVDSVVGAPLERVLGSAQAETLRRAMAGQRLERNPLYLHTVSLLGGRSFNAIAHRIDGVLVLELEPVVGDAELTFQNLYPLVRTFVARLQEGRSVRAISQTAAEEVRKITGFDRVLVYKFDPEWNGTVIAEDRDPAVYGSYMDLRFPSSDIPRQARELYRLNRLRLIADAGYTPVPVVPTDNPATNRPLDLSYASLRSVSPIHVEYLKNMGLAASMSISILHEGELWGLISCHHKTPRVVPFEVRTACEYLGQVLSLQLSAQQHREDAEHRMRLKSVQATLLAYMTHEERFVDGLLKHPEDLLGFARAGGAAIVQDGQVTLVGETPDQPDVRRLVDWLAEKVGQEVFATESLSAVFPDAAGYTDVASGLLGISISKLHRSYVLWFRPEVIRTVNWSGDPRKPVEPAPGNERLHPRKSFELWKETVRLKSVPWLDAEVDAAAEFRNAVVGIVLRKAEEMAQLSQELERTNQELEAFSYSVSHDLRAPFRHIVGYSELLSETEAGELSETGKRYLQTIIESAQYAGTLVDNLLAFSQMGRQSLHFTHVDMDKLVADVRTDVTQSEADGREIAWDVRPLPPVRGDAMMLKLAVRNLLANAVKYTRPRTRAVIEVGALADARPGQRETVYYVKDNGVGFDMRYADKLFGVFQRLHRMEEFEGTGIGLANVRRIVSRHGGRAWADARPDAGATFYFSLPKPQP